MTNEKRVGRYTIKSTIGQGGMGTVFRAHDPQLNRFVAVKVVNAPKGDRASFERRFAREAQTLANIDHPAIVDVYDFGVERGHPYLVMEYVEGGNLNYHLRQLAGTGKLYDLRQSLKIIADAAEALAAAHRQNIIHRDIKPDNILVKQFDINNELGVQGIVTDFGLVKIVEDDSRMTMFGTVLGTPDYMSPEQCLGEDVDGRTDIYSLGIVLYQVVTGVLPFHSDSLSVAIRNHTEVPPPLPTVYRHDLPASVQRIIERCLKKERADRYPSAEILARELRDVIETLHSEREAVSYFAFGSAAPPSQPERVISQLFIEHSTLPPRTVQLDKEQFTIGRVPENDIQLNAERISRYHARLAYGEQGWTITDLDSTNGTYFNGGRIVGDHSQPINDSTRIRIGPFKLRFKDIAQANNPIPDGNTSIVIVPGGGHSNRPPTDKQGSASPVTNVILQASPLNFNVKLEEFGGFGQDIAVKIINRTEITDHFSLEVDGIPSNWVKIRPTEVKLRSGESGDLKVIVTPPYSVKTRAGKHKYQLTARARTTRTQVAVQNGIINIAAFEKFSAEMHPQTIKHGRDVRLIFTNEGNGEIEYTVYGRDDADELRFTPNGISKTLDSGEEDVVAIKVEMRRRPWFRKVDPRSFEVEVTSHNSDQAIKRTGNLRVTPVARWLPFLLVFVLIFGVIGLFFLYRIEATEAEITRTFEAEVANATIAAGTATRSSQNATSQAQTIEAQFANVTQDALKRAEIATREKADEIATEEARAAAAVAAEQAAAAAAEATIVQQTVEAGLDTDGDSLSFVEEMEIYNTDPNKSDTDGDGLSDFDEITRCTEPDNPDSDADELTDGEEVLVKFTNPCNPDSDNDGILDNADSQPRSTPPPPTALIPTRTPVPPTPIPPTPIPPTPIPQNNNNSSTGNNSSGGNASSGSNDNNSSGNNNANSSGSNTATSGGNSGTAFGVNLLPNPSFEGSFDLQDNVQEYQLPDGWRIENVRDNEATAFGGTYFRPEVRTLSNNDLPEDERSLFILEGEQVVKIFKGGAPMRAAFVTTNPIALSPGEYELRIGIYADIVAHHDGSKQFATDPNSAQIRLVAGNLPTGFSPAPIGGDRARHIVIPFSVDRAFNGQIGIELDAPLVQNNNGWFLDDFSLTRTK